jgi:hypothetical protein
MSESAVAFRVQRSSSLAHLSTFVRKLRLTPKVSDGRNDIVACESSEESKRERVEGNGKVEGVEECGHPRVMRKRPLDREPCRWMSSSGSTYVCKT